MTLPADRAAFAANRRSRVAKLPDAATALSITATALGIVAAALSIATATGSLRAQATLPGAASLLPATAPTNGSTALAPVAAGLPGPVSSRPQLAAVSYSNGLLNVRANNSSLNAILREVSRATGMRVSGSVADQRVFGNYGPSDPATVLATLLDGTGSNMLLREAGDTTPVELILTPRTGGPSPPSPPAQEENNSAQAPADPGGGMGQGPLDLQRQRAASVFGAQVQTGAQGQGGARGQGGAQGPIGQPSVNDLQPGTILNQASPGMANSGASFSDQGATSAMSPGATGTGLSGPGIPSVGSANGDPKTPEQVYQLLQQLRQQSIRESTKQQ